MKACCLSLSEALRWLRSEIREPVQDLLANSKSRVCDRSTTAMGSEPDLMDCSRLPLVRKLMPKIAPNSNGIPTTAKMYPLRVTVTQNSRFAMTQTLLIATGRWSSVR